MQMAQHFEDISIDDILSVAEREHEAHSRFVQVLCINGEEGIDLVYSYQKTANQGYAVHNYRVHGVKPETRIPSVTKFYLVAFPFENEAHDLFGVQVDDIAIDFKGGFYKVAMDKPMTVISPAQKAAREKAAKLAAAKAAKAAKAAQEAASKTEAAAGEGAQAAPAIDWEAERAKVEAKCANLDADKAAKVMAAFEAKMKKAQAEAAKVADVKPAVDWEAERAKVEAKCANLPEDKAAKVMAAFEAKVLAAQGDASAKGGE